MDDLAQELGFEVEPDNDSDNDSTATGEKSGLPQVHLPFLNKPHSGSGFHESTRTCLERIRKAMLHHRWQEAAEYMTHYIQIMEDTTCGKEVQQRELIWRMSIELLHHLPNSTLEDYNNIYERIKHAGVKHYLVVCLEHSFHLLLSGHIEEAKRTLSMAESWRYGKESSAQYRTTQLIQAYRSLLDYVMWCEKRSASSSKDYSDTDDNQEMHNYFRLASAHLKEILKTPGVWDPFIVSYVEMLEFYEDHEKALSVLNDYAYDNSFPPNPNAHVYLYQYLKRRNTPSNKLIKVLTILHALVPSHELMLEYCSLLRESGKNGDVQKALEVIMDLLDYACWRNNLDVWRILKAIIENLRKEGDWEAIVSEVMSGRKDWWPALHFTRFHAAKDARENPELMKLKAPLAKILCPDLPLKYCAHEEGT